MAEGHPYIPLRPLRPLSGQPRVELCCLRLGQLGWRVRWHRAVANPPTQIPRKANKSMNTFTTPDGVEIFYKNWGSGQPIVFSHGWPLSADDWDAQMLFFLHQG